MLCVGFRPSLGGVDGGCQFRLNSPAEVQVDHRGPIGLGCSATSVSQDNRVDVCMGSAALSFADTEAAKDTIENVVGVDSAGDFSEALSHEAQFG